ncbi:MFS transporter [Paractinoplanes durhamensis]|nr:MFS transporter [Actinoplanes durhamensis]
MTFLRRPGTILALVTIGLGLNLRASILLGPHLHDRFAASPGWYVALIGLPVLVAALVRLPVGVLTDRYGVRVMLPAVSLVGALSVAGLGLARSLPAIVIAGAFAGVASSSFVVGAALVARMFPYGRRGRMLGIFGLGVAVAVACSALSWALDREGRLSALVLAGLLVAFAALSAVMIREPAPAGGAGSVVRECAALIRLASTSSVTLLYVVALSGMVSIAVFLPVHLVTTLHFAWFDALAVTGSVVTLASVARLVGACYPRTRLLATCYGVAAGLSVVVALAASSYIQVGAIAGIALCDGVAGGGLLALIGRAAPPGSAGAIMGVTGAAGSLGALVPPLLIVALPSHAAAWSLLAAVLVAAALYVRTSDLRVGLGLPVRFRPEHSPTTTTVAVLGEPDTRRGAAAVVARLAELATNDELLVVYGVGEQPGRGLSAAGLAAGLRARLPRHSVIALAVHDDPVQLGRDALHLVEHFEAGTLTIAVTQVRAQDRVAADLSIYLQADRVLAVSYDPASGAELFAVQ